MILKETVKVPATTAERIVGTQCDICAAVSKDNNGWAEKQFDVLETEIRYKDGWSGHDGGDGKELNVHLCPECFKNKLIPWLVLQGVKLNWEEWDW